MKIFETHAHYFDEAFNMDREEVLNDMKNNGIEKIIEIGDSIENSQKAINLSKKYDFIYAAVGIHPENAKNITNDMYEKLEEMIKNKEENKIVAIGEIGLDYYYEKETKEIQKEVFKKQLDLAIKYKLPVVIHTREASNDTFLIIKEYSKKGLCGIIHCFPEEVELANEYIKMNFKLGIGGILTFKNSRKLCEVVEKFDIKNFVVETDSPYLAPSPNRGSRNDSRNLKYIIEKIAEIKNMDKEEVACITYENAMEIYGFIKG